MEINCAQKNNTSQYKHIYDVRNNQIAHADAQTLPHDTYPDMINSNILVNRRRITDSYG